MTMGTVLPLLCMGAFAAFALYVATKRKKDSPAATRMFLETTGYRYTDILPMPLDAHVRHASSVVRNARDGKYVLHMVRELAGRSIHNVQHVAAKASYTSVSYTWSTSLESPARTRFQVADKKLHGTGKAVKEAFSSHTRCWKPAYETQVHSGDIELDKRFVFYGQDPAAVRLLINQPGMREMLLRCAEVDLVVGADEVIFSDPQQKNLQAVMGSSAMSGNVMDMMERSIPVHDTVTQLLVTTAALCMACPTSIPNSASA